MWRHSHGVRGTRLPKITIIMQITFVTSNKGKLRHAEEVLRNFDISITNKVVDLIEPRDEEPETIVVEKALQAIKIVNEPLMVEDAGVFIRALNGFPKTFVHFTLDSIGIEGIMKLMEGVADRHVEFRQSLAFIEPGMDKPVLFSYVDGNFKVADKIWDPLYEGVSDLHKILIPPGEDRPLCTFDVEWKARRDYEANKETIHYLQLAKWLTSRSV